MTLAAYPPSTRLLGLHIGHVEPFGPEGGTSAIRKQAMPGPVAVNTLGLAGDQQADPRYHGGPDKAIHHYPFEHYAAWRAELPERAALFQAPGGFGENLSTLGLTEDNVCLGDIFRVGSAMLQVSQGRSPCWKLDIRFEVADMTARVLASGRTGWYYRVLEAGAIEAGDAFELIERRHADWPLARLWRVLFRERTDTDALARLAGMAVLAENWRARAARCLDESGPRG
jgi:MOSC domain-containing protein YiiM